MKNIRIYIHFAFNLVKSCICLDSFSFGNICTISLYENVGGQANYIFSTTLIWPASENNIKIFFKKQGKKICNHDVKWKKQSNK